tara:strand:- start:1161 stop:1793 length:633 start_codon:yes stop_codon:yes gene_type:complete
MILKVNETGKDILFIDICKTAGTSIGIAFDTSDLVSVIGSADSVYGNGQYPKKHHGLGERCRIPVKDVTKFDYIFSVVRNPYDRVLSLFTWHQKRGELKDISFSEFLTSLEDISASVNTLHATIPQVEYVKRGDVVVPDKILRFEKIKEDFNALLKELNLPSIPLPHANNSGSSKPSKEWYTKKDIERVNSYYHQDFKVFGYKKWLLKKI